VLLAEDNSTADLRPSDDSFQKQQPPGTYSLGSVSNFKLILFYTYFFNGESKTLTERSDDMVAD
jgi:hypothetical protein